MMLVAVGEDGAFGAEGQGQHRVAEDVAGRPLALDDAVLQAKHMMGTLADHADIVRYQQDRDLAFAVEPANQVVEVFLVVEVDAGGRLVQQEQLRMGQEGQAQKNTLQLAAGYLVSRAVQQALRSANLVEHFLHLAANLAADAEEERAFLQGQRQEVPHRERQVGFNAQLLGDVADMLRRRRPVVVAAVELDGPRVRDFLEQARAAAWSYRNR